MGVTHATPTAGMLAVHIGTQKFVKVRVIILFSNYCQLLPLYYYNYTDAWSSGFCYKPGNVPSCNDVLASTEGVDKCVITLQFLFIYA